MLHKILILAASLIAASILLNHFLNGADIDWNGMLIAGIIIVHNVRELQLDKIKEQYETAFVSLSSFRFATLSVCDNETINRISLKAADIIVESAPEDLQPELRKVNELLKKMRKSKQGADKNEEKTQD